MRLCLAHQSLWIAVAECVLGSCSRGASDQNVSPQSTPNATESDPSHPATSGHAPELAFPHMEFYIRDHSQGGNVGATLRSDAIDWAAGEISLSVSSEGEVPFSVAPVFDAGRSTSTMDLYVLTCVVPENGAGRSTFRTEVRYKGTNLEAWRSDTHVIGLRPRDPK